MLQPQSKNRHADTSRRTFLAASLGAGAALAFAAPTLAQRRPRPAGGLRVLILGGTAFLGPETITAAKARGHTVTIFNRGKTEKRLGTRVEGVERVYGNRDPDKPADDAQPESTENPKGLSQLQGKEFDAVIDNSGYFPRIVKASAEWAAKSAKYYLFISTISVYKGNDQPGAGTDAEVGTIDDPTVETFGRGFENYGPLKALSERAAEAAMPDKSAIVRPGLIVGPGDPTGRFTYWPVRAQKGGEVLAPGSPDDPIQMIDVRDLAEWVVMLVENKTTGVFNAVGPQEGLTMGKVLDGCKNAAPGDAKFTWCDAAFLESQGVSAWGDMPVWVPPSGESAGMHRRDVIKSTKAGLKFRDVADTCAATLAWHKALPDDSPLKKIGGIAPEREKAVLEEWHKTHDK